MNVITPTSYIFQAVFNTPYSQTPVVTSSYIFTEYFEGGTGFDNVDGWTIIGNVTTSYATAPAPLQGAQSIRVDGLASSGRVRRDFMFSDSRSFGNIWMAFQYHPTQHTASNDRDFFWITSGSTQMVGVTLRSTRTVRASCGTGVLTTTATMQSGSTYWVWLNYTTGSGGNNSIAKLYFSTSSIRPASGSANFAQTNVGSLSGSSTGFALYSQNLSSYGYTNIFDSILVSTSEIVNVT